MKEKTIRRPDGSIIGRVRHFGNRIEARTVNGKLLGWYCQTTDRTRKPNGQLFAIGYALEMLFC